MDPHESLVALKVVEWVGDALIRLNGWHFEPFEDWRFQNMSRKGRPRHAVSWFSVFLHASELAVKLA